MPIRSKPRSPRATDRPEQHRSHPHATGQFDSLLIDATFQSRTSRSDEPSQSAATCRHPPERRRQHLAATSLPFAPHVTATSRVSPCQARRDEPSTTASIRSDKSEQADPCQRDNRPRSPIPDPSRSAATLRRDPCHSQVHCDGPTPAVSHADATTLADPARQTESVLSTATSPIGPRLPEALRLTCPTPRVPLRLPNPVEAEPSPRVATGPTPQALTAPRRQAHPRRFLPHRRDVPSTVSTTPTSSSRLRMPSRAIDDATSPTFPSRPLATCHGMLRPDSPLRPAKWIRAGSTRYDKPAPDTAARPTKP